MRADDKGEEEPGELPRSDIGADASGALVVRDHGAEALDAVLDQIHVAVANRRRAGAGGEQLVRLDRPAATDAPEVHGLDDLLALDADQLEALYSSAGVPRLDAVKGDLRGRMLAWPSVPRGPLATLLRRMASSSRFPWRGKTFTPTGDSRGEGVNRVLRDRWHLYRFDTSIGRSRAGEFDALQLNYGRTDNPFFIRPIRDEIRELSPSLYLGQAWLEIGARPPSLVLYFGLASG